MSSRTGSSATTLVLTAWLLAASTAAGAGPGSAPESNESIARQLAAAATAEDWPRALELARRLVASQPESPSAHYQLACALARNGDARGAVDSLRAAAELGFSYTSTLLRDHDLDAIRSDPGYAAALERVQASNRAALEAFKLRAKRARIEDYVPPGNDPDRPAPLIIALHGYGATARDIAGAYREVAVERGAILIAPEAIEPAGKGFSWGVMEEGEHLVLEALEHARRAYRIDLRRVVLTGFSQGAELAFFVGLRHPERFAGVLPVAGVFDQRVMPLPTGPSDPRPRFYILNGALDLNAGNNREAAAALEGAGIATRLRIVDGVGHAYPPDHRGELKKALDFLLFSRSR